MALIVNTTTPDQLLANIRATIDKKGIVTWTYDSEGDFTHTTSSEQWEEKAWMRPIIVPGVLIFEIVARGDEVLTKPIYGVYHGRFAEMLLTHFDHDFTSLQATALLRAKIDVYKRGT